ncbi:RING-H2 finger protein ATL10 [Schistosoma japonicum]|nr:RING-H2 finger protein ATL10 [Schistosoma japonicum]
MFSDDLFSCFLPANFFSNSIMSGNHISQALLSHERAFRHVHQEFQRVAQEIFNSSMFPRQFCPSHIRDISIIPAERRAQRGNLRVTLDGDDGVNNLRAHRHFNSDPVPYERTRLQWYDSNTRRSFLPEPPARPEVSRFLTTNDLAKLPTSIYRIKKCSSTNNDSFASPDSTENVATNPTVVPVLNVNQNDKPPSPGTHYLQPESKGNTLVQIQPIQSSPARGHPECEICLIEYQNKDRLRHLPCGHAFHVKCIDAWLKQSTTCPKCRAGIRTGLARLERARQRLKAQPNNGTNSKATPIQPARQRPNQRSSNMGQGPQSTNRNQTNTRSSVIGTTSDTQTNRVTRGRLKPSAAATNITTTSSTNRGTNAPTNQRNQKTIFHSNSSQYGSTSEPTNENHIEDNQRFLTTRKSSIREHGGCQNKINESIIARRKAVEAAMRRAAVFDTIQQQSEVNAQEN